MSITFFTSDPQGLLDSIYEAIDKKHIETWLYDSDGDLTHEPEQWRYLAWMWPLVEEGSLKFAIVKRKSEGLSREVYAIYHGRLNEMMLAHFDRKFTRSVTTALLEVPPDTDNS